MPTKGFPLARGSLRRDCRHGGGIRHGAGPGADGGGDGTTVDALNGCVSFWRVLNAFFQVSFKGKPTGQYNFQSLPNIASKPINDAQPLSYGESQ